MRISLTLFLLCVYSSFAFAQDSTVHASKPFKSFEKQSTLLGITFGLGDYNKQNYKMPDSSRNGSASMSMPIYFRAERAVGQHLSLALSLGYDVYYYSYQKEGYGNGSVFYRPNNDKVRVITPGLGLYYHFNQFIHNPNIDVFIGAGANAQYVKHTDYPSTDTTHNTIKPDINPFVRLGVRYYINRNAAFFGDVGYDKISLISLGFSFRLYGRVLSL